MNKYVAVGIVLSMAVCVQRANAMSDGFAAVTMGAAVVSPTLSDSQENDLNALDADGETQLHKAVEAGDVATVRRLLGLRANPNVVDAHGCSPFRVICEAEVPVDPVVRAQQCAMAVALYLNGADDSNGIPDYILEGIYRAEITDRLERENTVILCGSSETQNLLVQNLKLAALVPIVQDYLCDIKAIRPLREHIISVGRLGDYATHAGRLRSAADTGKVLPLLEVLYVDSDINDVVYGLGNTLLHAASGYGHVALVELLVQSRANLDVQNGFGVTPLYRAACRGHAEIAHLLLSYGANINMQVRGGRTPLHQAIEGRNRVLVDLLLRRGANDSIRDNDGRTPLAYAMVLYPDEEIVRLLKEHRAQKKQKSRAEHAQCCVLS